MRMCCSSACETPARNRSTSCWRAMPTKTGWPGRRLGAEAHRDPAAQVLEGADAAGMVAEVDPLRRDGRARGLEPLRGRGEEALAVPLRAVGPDQGGATDDDGRADEADQGTGDDQDDRSERNLLVGRLGVGRRGGIGRQDRGAVRGGWTGARRGRDHELAQTDVRRQSAGSDAGRMFGGSRP